MTHSELINSSRNIRVITRTADGQFNEHSSETFATKLLKTVRNIEVLEEQKASLAAAINASYEAAQAHGFDKKVLKKLIADRKIAQDELELFETELGQYRLSIASAERFEARGRT